MEVFDYAKLAERFAEFVEWAQQGERADDQDLDLLDEIARALLQAERAISRRAIANDASTEAYLVTLRRRMLRPAPAEEERK